MQGGSAQDAADESRVKKKRLTAAVLRSPRRLLARWVKRWRPLSARALGDRARDRQAWGDAARAYAAHVSLRPDEFAIWVQLGHAYREDGDGDAALAAYRAALMLRDDDGDLLLHLGRLLLDRKEFKEAAGFLMRSAASGMAIEASKALKRREIRPFLTYPHYKRSVDSCGPRRPVQAIPGQLEAVDGWTARGWAVDEVDLDRPAQVVFFQHGREVGRAIAAIPRMDWLTHRMSATGFEAQLDIDFSSGGPVDVSARLATTGVSLLGSPLKARPPRALAQWLRREHLKADELELVQRGIVYTVGTESLSIVMPVYNPPADWLREALDSVRGQTCRAWELICVDDASTEAHVGTILNDYASLDARIKSISLSKNGGIAAATNAGIAVASGTYVGFMDHDDALEPNAVGCVLSAAAVHGSDLIYTDEVVTGESLNRIVEVRARPAFCYDYYLSHPYFVHFIAVRRNLAVDVGGLDGAMDISADVDFVLRTLERARIVTHVPVVAYRWRTHATSTGHGKQYLVTAATVAALNRHLKRTDSPATAHPGLVFNCHRIEYPDRPGRTLIIIPSRNGEDLLEKAVNSIRATTVPDEVDVCVVDHDSDSPGFHRFLRNTRGLLVERYTGPFNFAAMNNRACERLGASYDYLCFMNNDVEALNAGWLENMRRLAGRDDIGVVGATLLYPDRRIQHAGVVIGLADLADHGHKFVAGFLEDGQRNPGYNASLTSTRSYSAVTAACMMMRRTVFEEVSGFDETLEVGFNDTDLCLRVGERGYKILTTPDALLIHYESVTRRGSDAMDHPQDAARFRVRWAELLSRGDPFYNPALSTDPARDHHVERLDHGVGNARNVQILPAAARLTRIAGGATEADRTAADGV